MQWLGYAAATLTTVAFVPQAWLTLRTRQVAGISAPTYVAFSTGVALWLVYGLTQQDWPLVVANAITFPLAASILATKLHVDWQARRGLPRAQ